MRRILFAIGFLALVDPLVVFTVQRLERSRYESDRLFRFEDSDLFAIGPVVEYLRENPKGKRHRVVFFGNSVVWGHGLDSWETVPAQFQRLAPKSKVINWGVNGSKNKDAILTTKAIIDSVDVVYLFHNNFGPANLLLPRLIPIAPEDIRRFGLTPLDPLERTLEDLMGFWKLYRYSYRLQAALFGTSTRLFVHLNKGKKALAALRGWRPPEGPLAPTPMSRRERQLGVAIDTQIARNRPSEERARRLAAKYPFLWEFAELIRDHEKVGIIVELAHYNVAIEDADRADVNAHFHPNVRFLKLHVPRELQIDGLHLSSSGTRAVAESLFVHTAALIRFQ